MTDTICLKDQRREEVRKHASLAGLDYLEVSDEGRLLTVYFLGRAPHLAPENLVIEGGVRITGITVVSVSMTTSDVPEFDDFMEVKLDSAGDFSPYRLLVVDHDDSGRTIPHPSFDVRYNSLEFRFHVECLNEFDCLEERACPPPVPVRPEINYLAKDYASFQRVIFDRLATLMPEWQERHVPDFGVALVELLAYTGDYLSYYQDSVATEAYLDTARRRISVRRHARLVDYRMHEGCNARAWVHLEAIAEPEIDLADIYFITNGRDRIGGLGRTTTREELLKIAERLPPGAFELFEPVAKGKITLHEAHNRIRFYTWGDKECCLPRGATSAVLIADDGKELKLSAGDVLLFEEVLGPGTGAPADADPGHRHLVRLIRVTALEDALNGKHIVEIAWAEEDALPFALCLSVKLPAPRCEVIEDVSVARGNIILVDHGESVSDGVGVVPPGKRTQECGCGDIPSDVILTSGRYRPRLPRRLLTFRAPFDDAAPASAALLQDAREAAREAAPAVTLASIRGGPDGAESLYNWPDLRNPVPVLARLKADKPDLATLLLRSLLSSETRHLLAKYDPSTPAPQELLDALAQDLRRLLQSWTAAQDLMTAGPMDFLFVVEMENDGYAHLRFGDDTAGRRPAPGMFFQASYRVGNGPSGNVGAEVINTLVTRTVRLDGAVRAPRSPHKARPFPMATPNHRTPVA
jgi:hypothetical protein